MESGEINDNTTEVRPTQKMSHRKWKAMMRKQKRKAKRQLEDQQKTANKAESVSESEDEAALQAQEEERQRQHQLWLEREKKAEEEWLAKQEREKKEKERRLEAEQKIREEWEERQKKEKEEEEEREKIEREKKEKQVTWSESLVDYLYTGTQPTQVLLKNVAQLLQQATANDNKDSWHNPIAPVVYGKERDKCPFFMKTGACRFAERCSRSHTYPESSCTILLPGMFANFRLEQSLVDENDTDLALEYDDKEMYENFTEFYNDVLPEFRLMGRVIQFKVSCNCEPHLRGNVYVQYQREDDAQKAFVKFNGRWYGGRQISCVFINIAKWKSAICGQAFVNRCPKGKSCNFLHVFRNPGNEFWLADKDYEMSERDHRSSDQRDGRYRYGSDRRDRYSHRDRFDHNGRNHSYDSRYNSRRHNRSRSRSRSPKSKGGNRSRSRSPSRSRRKRSRSRSRKSRSPSRSIRHRSCSRSPKSRSKHRKSTSPASLVPKTTRRKKSESRSPSRSSKRRSQSKGQRSRSRSPSHSMYNVRTSSNGQSNGTHKAKNTESSSESDSETSRSSRSVSKTKHKKSKKHKKHKHKSHKKNSNKVKSKAKASPASDPYPESLMDLTCPSVSDPESPEDHNDKPNIIEIPQDSGEEDIGDVIFEDVYV